MLELVQLSIIRTKISHYKMQGNLMCAQILMNDKTELLMSVINIYIYIPAY